MTVFKQILQYLLGAYLLFMSLGYLIIGGNSIIGAIISFLSAMLIIPITRNLIEKNFNFEINKAIKYSLPFIGFFAPFFFIDYDKIANSGDNKNQVITDTIVAKKDSTEIENSKKISQASNVLPIAAIPNTSNKISESSNLNNKKVTKYSSRTKSNYTASKRKKANNSRTIKTHTYQSSSGICGHANKTGGYCKRRVKGGGYCWQHS